jgi:hypothetical protein
MTPVTESTVTPDDRYSELSYGRISRPQKHSSGAHSHTTNDTTAAVTAAARMSACTQQQQPSVSHYQSQQPCMQLQMRSTVHYSRAQQLPQLQQRKAAAVTAKTVTRAPVIVGVQGGEVSSNIKADWNRGGATAKQLQRKLLLEKRAEYARGLTAAAAAEAVAAQQQQQQQLKRASARSSAVSTPQSVRKRPVATTPQIVPLPQFSKLTPIQSAVSPKRSTMHKTAVVLDGSGTTKTVQDSVTGVSLSEQQLAQSIERLNQLLATATHSSSTAQGDSSSSDHAAAATGTATAAAPAVPFVRPQGRQSAWSKRRVSRVHPGVLRSAYGVSTAVDSAVVFRTHDAHLALL